MMLLIITSALRRVLLSSLLVLHRYIFKVKQYYAPGTKTVGDPEYSMHINEVQT